MSISAAEFLKWVQVFNLSSGGIIPGEVTLQAAYTGGATINLAAASPIAINTSVGTQGVMIGDKGTQLHAPIYSLLASNLNLTADLIDLVFQNNGSSVANTLTIQSSVTYSQNAYFKVIGNGSQTITVQTQTGVTLDGIDAGMVIVLPGQAWEFYQISSGAWISVNVQPIAGVGIEIDSGVINNTGGSGSVSCAFSASLLGALLNATGDGTLVNVTCNSVSFNIGSAYDSSTGIFTAPTDGIYLFGNSIELGNLSGSYTQYLFYVLANGVTYMMSQGNPANERSASNQLTRRGAILLDLTAGQTVQLQVEVDGGSKSVSINSGAQPTSFFGYLVSNTAGAAGVSSILGLTGFLNFSSPDSTVSITPSGSNILFNTELPGGDWTPTIAVLSGGSFGALNKAKFLGAKPSSGGIVIATTEFSITPDGSAPLVSLSLSNPLVGANFSAVTQAEALGFSIRTAAGGAGQIGQGALVELYADTTGTDILCTLETAQNIPYIVNLSWMYKIQ